MIYMRSSLLSCLASGGTGIAARWSLRWSGVLRRAPQRYTTALRQGLRRRDTRRVGVEQRVPYQLRADHRGTDAIESQLGVGLLSLGVVNTADDPRHMERVLGDLRRQDVAIVAVGDGDETFGL